MTILQTLFTGKDNTSFDLSRVLWAFLTVAMVGQEAFAALSRAAVRPDHVLHGFGCDAGRWSGALTLKRKTEPGA